MNYRNELKYSITNRDFELLKCSLESLLKKDEHCFNNFYTITSIYFDNYKKTSYNQVKNGISERYKYRIRFYNYDSEFIKLEKKQKLNGLTNKKSIIITKELLFDILNNNVKISNLNDKLLNELILKMKTEYLRPIICVEYDRIPFIYKLGNVRITLDYNIRYTNKYNDLFNSKKDMRYLCDKILEVKYDEFIPDYVRYRLQLNSLHQISYSKFNNCIDDLNGRF